MGPEPGDCSLILVSRSIMVYAMRKGWFVCLPGFSPDFLDWCVDLQGAAEENDNMRSVFSS